MRWGCRGPRALGLARRRADRQHQHHAGDEEQRDRRHAEPLATGRRGDGGDEEGRHERRHLARECEQPEELRDLLGRREAREQRAARGLHRRRDEADDHREGEEHLLADRGERRRARHLRRHLDDVEDVRLVDRQDAEGAHEQDRTARARMTALALKRSSSTPPMRAPNAPISVSTMPKMPSAQRAPAEHGRAVDAAEGEDGGEPVGEDHAGGEKEQHVGMAAAASGSCPTARPWPGARRAAAPDGCRARTGRTGS